MDLSARIATLLTADLPVADLSAEGRSAGFGQAPFVACVPACDEEERIARCLAALDNDLAPGDAVLCLANGCRDATLAEARRATAAWTRPVLLASCRWRAGEGSAPRARRLALDIASALSPDAILFSTDADTFVRRGLRAAYVDEFALGFDLVCGQIDFIEAETHDLPPLAPEAEWVVREYRAVSREIAARLCPDPDNPWPHHGNIGGANFAIRGAAYRRAGPLPTPSAGEDRMLRRRFEALGLRIRYADGPSVETSPRLVGRATGGLSEELARERREADPLVDELLEPPETLVLRCRARREFLLATSEDSRREALAPIGLSAEDALRLAGNGGPLAWHEAEELSPALRRRRLRRSHLRAHLPALQSVLAAIREAPSGNPAFR